MKRLYNKEKLVLEGDDEIIDYVHETFSNNKSILFLTEEEFYAQASIPKFYIKPDSLVELDVVYYSNHSYRINVAIDGEDLNEACIIEESDVDDVLLDLIAEDVLRLRDLQRVFDFDTLFANGVKFVDADDHTLEYDLENFIMVKTNTDS
jgi:hypothetical protein